MNTKAYEKLLSELGIPSDWSPENREAMLEKKCGEALELLNVAQQRGETDKVKQLEDRIAEMGDAMEHTKELQKYLSSGLIMDIQNEKDRLKELKEAGKEKAQTVRELAGATQPISNASATQQPVSTPQPVSVSQTASQYQGQFRRAGMELEDKNWEKAKQLYNDILDADPENAEANLGLFMANRQISGKKHIPEAARSAWKNNVDLFQDSYFLRAKRFANAALKKELGDMEKGRDYLLAVEELQRAKTGKDYEKTARMFDKLGDFADAKTKKKEAAYRQAEADLKQANDISGVSAAKKLFEGLGDYADSKKKAEECESMITQLKDAEKKKDEQRQKEREAYEKYKQEYDQFEKETPDRTDIKELGAKIKSKQARLASLQTKKGISPIKKRWIFLAGYIGLLLYFLPGLMYYFFPGVILSSLQMAADSVSALLPAIIFAVILCSGFVRFFMRRNGGFFAFVKGIVTSLIVLAVIAVFFAWLGYTFEPFIDRILSSLSKARFIGMAALLIAIAMIAINILAWITQEGRKAEITRLERGMDANYHDMEKIIETEYQKIFDRYPDIGPIRKSVSEAQTLIRQKMGVPEKPRLISVGGTGKKWNSPFGKKRLPVGKWIIGLSAAAVLFYAVQFGLVKFLDIPSGWFVFAYAPNILFKEVRVEYTPSPYYISLRPLDELYIGEECNNLSKIIAPFGVKNLRLKQLTDERTSAIGLLKGLEGLTITDSPNLTEEGFAALKIPETVKRLQLGDGSTPVYHLKKLDISNDLESLLVFAKWDFTANVNGDVQKAELFSTGNLAVNLNGDVQLSSNYAEGETLAINVNGYVEKLDLIHTGESSIGKNLTVDGTGRIDRMDLRYQGNDLALNVAPKALKMNGYSGENELVLPEGIEILKCEDGPGLLQSLPIPGSVRLLKVASNGLDFDALKIPEGILYYQLDSGRRDDHREYQAENCPQEFVGFDFDQFFNSEDAAMPDLSRY